MAVTVVDNSAESRFDVLLSGAVVGSAFYTAETGRLVFTHTEIDPSVGGQGIGSALARGALDAVRAAGLHAVPICPFIAAYIRKHPEYVDLVPVGSRYRVQ